VHPSLKLDITTSTEEVNFMDMTISKGARWRATGYTQLDTAPYEKPMNRFLYIPYTSNHPRASLTGFIAGEARRFICLSSNEQAALDACDRLVRRLHARGYPLQTILEQLTKVHYDKRMEYITPKHRDSHGHADTRTAPLIMRYAPWTEAQHIGKQLHEALAPYSWIKPVVAWCNGLNLSNLLKRNYP
jgi:hypothetical protein